jgi:hypothetical protein
MPNSLKLSQSFLREVGGWVGKHPYRVLSLRIVKLPTLTYPRRVAIRLTGWGAIHPTERKGGKQKSKISLVIISISATSFTTSD